MPFGGFGATGSVFTMTNSPSGNSVVAYNRAPDGLLTYAGTYATGGLGLSGLTGTNQGGLTLSQSGSWLFVVDAGSNQISVFRVSQFPTTSLYLTDVVSSGGVAPNSVTVHGDWVYVLNSGTPNIAGFYLTAWGTLVPIPGSVRPLSGSPNPGAAEVSFSPSGTNLVVTEKSSGTNGLLDGYSVNFLGVASAPVVTPSHGDTPFGFAFDPQGQAIVSEAASDAASSYSVAPSGALTVVSGSVSNGGQAAPCWVVATPNGQLAFTANAHTDTISAYAIGQGGTLTLLKSVAANTEATDIDMALSQNGAYLYVYDAGANAIQAFSVHSNGVLTLIQTVSGLTAGGDGLAAN